jgi:hypothetical protein
VTGLTIVESWPGSGKPASNGHTTSEVEGLNATVEFLTESLAELEQAMREPGWIEMATLGQLEFSRQGIQHIITASRLMAMKNPLIGRALRVRGYYVFGQGVEISARDEGLNEILRRFLDDPSNKAELFGHQARTVKDWTLGTDGNLFLVLVPNRITGHVKVRSIITDEIDEIIKNPQDRREIWFYRRRWVETVLRPDGTTQETAQREAFYPHWQYRPKNKPAAYGRVEVRWDQPIYHIRSGGHDAMSFGIPSVYAALDWARAHTKYLEDWATMVSSLSRFAWKMTGSKKARSSAATKLGTTLGTSNPVEGNDPPATGAMALVAPGADLTPIPKTGATVEAEDGRHLRLMVGSATDLPDTILAGDADVGNLATAKTLDRPTELAMRDRQSLWADVYRDLCSFFLECQVRAPRGRLFGRGTVVRDDDWNVDVVTLTDRDPETGDLIDATIEVNFPSILEQDIAESVKAIVLAATLDGKTLAGSIPIDTVAQLLLTTLGVDDVDELLQRVLAEWEAAEQERRDREDAAVDAAAQAGVDKTAAGQIDEVLAGLKSVLAEAMAASASR